MVIKLLQSVKCWDFFHIHSLKVADQIQYGLSWKIFSYDFLQSYQTPPNTKIEYRYWMHYEFKKITTIVTKHYIKISQP